jgi:hypothetical protein
MEKQSCMSDVKKDMFEKGNFLTQTLALFWPKFSSQSEGKSAEI